MLGEVPRVAKRITAEARRRATRALYDFFSTRKNGEDVTFLNFGFVPVDVPHPDPLSRPCAQLYHEVASGAPLRGRRVVEISSGRGGGAAWLMEHHGPASLVGVDLSPKAVAFCRARHRAPGLSFVVGDAESLPFSDASFDVALNVEAAINYPDLDRFASEVHRVLRPGGAFLFTDICRTANVASLRSRLARPGFVLTGERDVTENVLRALDARTEGVSELVDRTFPWVLRRPVREFAAIRGTSVYRDFESRAVSYWIFSLERRP